MFRYIISNMTGIQKHSQVLDVTIIEIANSRPMTMMHPELIPILGNNKHGVTGPMASNQRIFYNR